MKKKPEGEIDIGRFAFVFNIPQFVDPHREA